MTLLQKLTNITGLAMPMKELLRDIILNICAVCHYGQRPGYPVYTAIDEDAWGPLENIPTGNRTAYLSTTLNEMHLDRCRISIPFLATDDMSVQILINGTALFPVAISMPGTFNGGTGTRRFDLDDFATAWQSEPVPDGARIEVVTSYTNFDPSSGLGSGLSHKGLRVRLEGRWL